MSIIIKFILKNIKEKKLRTLLIVISIMASSALFFAANGISSSVEKTYINVMKSVFGSAEISITPNDKSPSPYFTTDKADFYRNKVDYIVGELGYSGVYKPNKDDVVIFSLKGVDYDDLMMMNPIPLIDKTTIKPFSGNKIIISKKAADKYNIKVGDRLQLNINKQQSQEDKKTQKNKNNEVSALNENKSFNVVAIAAQEGIFKFEDNVMIAAVPKETVAEFNNAKGRVSTIYIKTKNSSDRDQLIEDLSSEYKDYDVRPTINEKEIAAQTSSIRSAFLMMLVIVLIMSVFIIYTVFKVIIIERLPVIGTFRSIGATKRMTNVVLIVESLIYGIIGGIIGDAVGIGILKLVGMVISKQSSVKVTIEYTPMQLITALIFAIIVSFISAIIPIIRASRISVKDIVLNTVDTVERTKLWKLILGPLLLAVSITLPRYISKQMSGPVDVACMIFAIIATVMLIPYITLAFVKILENLYSIIFGNEGILAAKNLRSNRSIINNISLLAIGISTLFMLNVVSYSFGEELVKAYGILKTDVLINSRGSVLDKEVERKAKTISGVDELFGLYSANEVNIVDTKTQIMGVYGYNKDKYSTFMNIKLLQDENKALKNFEDDRNILITENIRSNINAQIGDVITLNTPKGNKEYRITGTFSTLMNNGKMAMIPEKYLKYDFNLKVYNTLLVKTNGDPQVVSDALNKEFKRNKLYISTWKEMEAQNKKQIDQMLQIIKIFPIIALFIGAFGVLNNFIISFIERKRYLAVFASVGMSRMQTIKMLFIEAISVGIIGAFMGSIGGYAITTIVPFMLKAADFPMSMYYDYSLFLTCFILGTVITLVASLAPSLKSSKLNIIEAIKYE